MRGEEESDGRGGVGCSPTGELIFWVFT